MMKKACDHRQSLLMDIQKVDFMLVDLNEFLDTHPTCQEALDEYSNLVRVSQKLRCSFEKQYGPLMTLTWDSSQNDWPWIQNPWPWDVQ